MGHVRTTGSSSASTSGPRRFAASSRGKEDNGGLDVIGVGRSASRGLRKGVVVNVDQTVDALKSAVEEAELMAGETVDEALRRWPEVTSGVQQRGDLDLGPRARGDPADIERVIESARNDCLP